MILRLNFLPLKIILLAILVFSMQYPVIPQESSEQKKKPTIGLVLSGGGARGFAHIGVIKVLEEEGIDVDIIGGTSMGSIVGGLYAMGYSIDVIEEIALTQDWDYILNDMRNRRDLGFYEKFDDEVHIFSLALKNKKVSIPPGLVYGQNTTNLLTKLTSPAYQTHEFKDLNKPFFCMATDLLSGKVIKMDTGNLAIAIRASMSVPSAFVPVEYGPYYLVDGGLMNNFPAKEVKELGADYLIGVDIQTPLLKQDKINNLVQVLSQSLFFYAEDVFNENLEIIDLLIKPEIDPFTAMDFGRADSLILRGEKKAREMIPQIRAFMDSIGLEPKESARREYNIFPDMDIIYVDKVIFKGNDKVSDEYLLKKLDIQSGDQISVIELNNKITHLYGTKLFHTINYALEYSTEGETNIIVEIQEATLFDVNVGAHYNDYAKAGLLLNLTGRNFGAPNGRLSIDLALGKVSRFTTKYIVDNGMKPGFGGDINIFSQSGYIYNENGKRTLSFDMAVNRNQGFGLLTMNNISRFRIGYELEANTIKQGISIIDFDNLENVSAGVYTDLVIDTYDRLYMPNKGVRFFARFDLGFGENTDINLDSVGNVEYTVMDFTYSALTFDLSGVIPIGDHFIIKPEIYFRRTFGSVIPLTKTSFFGGFSQTYIFNYKPFPGYEFMEIDAQMVYYPQLTIRHNFWENHYLSLKGNLLSIDFNFDETLEQNEFYYGWQLSYTYYSLIGPISISAAEAYPKGKMVYEISLGFWF